MFAQDVAEDVVISEKSIRAAVTDVVKSAEVAKLVYVHDSCMGIQRLRKNGDFIYMDGKKRVTKKSDLDRIRKLAIPPAWEDVWICRESNGHLQVTGKDARGRKQYKYHPSWNAIRSTTKFYRLLEFGRQLPAMRRELQKHLALPAYPKEKIMALVVSLLERTNIRIGNGAYEKLYGSFGLTTLKNSHVQVKGAKVNFMFRGKKGIRHNISMKSKKLARLIQNCKDIPGKDLFEYIDDNGNIHHVDSGMVNIYIHSISGHDFSAKDFRTWAGSCQALLGFHEAGDFRTIAEFKEKTLAVIDHVAKALGNTRTVCRKYYIHPLILRLYEEKKLDKYLEGISPAEEKDDTELRPEEKVLIRILETN
jgi:DNA topoisomerase-1